MVGARGNKTHSPSEVKPSINQDVGVGGPFPHTGAVAPGVSCRGGHVLGGPWPLVGLGDASLRLVSEWRSVEEVENEIDCKLTI